MPSGRRVVRPRPPLHQAKSWANAIGNKVKSANVYFMMAKNDKIFIEEAW
jgi:hypothetical protein